MKSHYSCKYCCWKRSHFGIIDIYSAIVVIACHCNSVFSSFQLRLQIAETRIRFQLRILLADDEQPAQRAGELRLVLLELVEGLGVGQHVVNVVGCQVVFLDMFHVPARRRIPDDLRPAHGVPPLSV